MTILNALDHDWEVRAAPRPLGRSGPYFEIGFTHHGVWHRVPCIAEGRDVSLLRHIVAAHNLMLQLDQDAREMHEEVA